MGNHKHQFLVIFYVTFNYVVNALWNTQIYWIWIINRVKFITTVFELVCLFSLDLPMLALCDLNLRRDRVIIAMPWRIKWRNKMATIQLPSTQCKGHRVMQTQARRIFDLSISLQLVEKLWGRKSSTTLMCMWNGRNVINIYTAWKLDETRGGWIVYMKWA